MVYLKDLAGGTLFKTKGKYYRKLEFDSFLGDLERRHVHPLDEMGLLFLPQDELVTVVQEEEEYE